VKAQGTLVLLYHRVANLRRDPHGLAVAPDRFAQHCEILRKRCHVVRLSQSDRSKRQVAITFDDGYVDNAGAARRVLAAADLPATFFVTVGPLGRTGEVWWDRIEQMFLETEPAASSIEIEIRGQRLWADIRSSGARERAHLTLFWRLRPLPPAEIESVLMDLERQLGVQTIARETHRWMTGAELRALSESPQVEIGAHTVTHPFLAAAPADQQWQEIQGSRESLRRLLGTPPSLFSYPYGGSDAVTPATTEMVRRAGYTMACTAVSGIAYPECDPLMIPRNVVGDWDGERFEAWIDRWLSQP
jgi:peptidoglycan/xylan/chitin deacetylase (PgdA/CDA1 family)